MEVILLMCVEVVASSTPSALKIWYRVISSSFLLAGVRCTVMLFYFLVLASSMKAC